MLILFKLLALTTIAIAPQQEPLGEYWGTAEEESRYYKLVDIPLPEELAVEAGSFEVLPDQNQLAIATRRGDIFLVQGAFDEHPEPQFKKFASGLDEVFGMAFRDGSFYVTQQTEVTRITDIDGDGRADRFDTLSDQWGFRNYHEFAFGSKPDQDGNIWVALCLSESYNSKVPYRGWCLKITPDGKTIPICSGIRSPCGVGPNEHGVMFYAESQGPWNGSCSLKVLEPGGFMGHPVSFNWYELAPELGPAPVVPHTPSRMETERKRVKELVPYAVVFPYKRMGRSISGFMVDQTGGKFGPFENQIFIGDFSLGVVMRATTEKVNGVWQGACYPFREGFDTGLLAVQFTPEGSLIAGGTNRGWPVRGSKSFAVQRLDWTGLVPFEIKEIKATPNGFEIEFTLPVDRELASKPETYRLKTFTHIYRQGYGSPEVDQTIPMATLAEVSEDGKRVNIIVDGLVQGHVHDFYLPDMRSANDQKLLHTSAYYTLNEIPTLARNDDNAAHTIELPRQIHFKRRADAVQLVGESGSQFVPESHYQCQWTFADGILTASPQWDSVVTPEAYQDFQMHLEFNVNEAGDVPRERNGNSGVYIQQRYELQILNSFGVPRSEYKNDDCGCLYRVKQPDKLVSRPAGQWQSFDISFHAARFDGARKTGNARITVYQNRELIHDNVELKRHTGAGKKEERSARPIKLQGHRNQVQFRNVWIQETALKSNQGDEKSMPRITASTKSLPLPGESFKLNGSDAFIIFPKGSRQADEIPWVWYAPTLNGLPAVAEKWMFERFLAAGIAIAGVDVGESYGSPIGRSKYNDFYDYLIESRKFGRKPCLLARSRGGLMLYNWAIEHPQSVSGIAGIYPVCNIASYPGIEKAASAYEMTPEELTADLDNHNPINRLAPLAKANVPIFHIQGDSDKVVPLNENSAVVAKKYKELGGDMILEIVPDQGHNMWPGWFHSDGLVDFVLTSLDRPLDTHPVPDDDQWLTFDGGEGPGKGKHVVLIAAEQEYRSEQSLPNIIIIYADDLGYGDLSCYNSKCAYQTPRLDQMAREGIRFTDAHSPSTICSPSRYGLYSGQQIYRSTGRGGGAFEGPSGPSYLKPGTLTIAQMLKTQGYHTGVFGKWHVGLTWVDSDGKRLGGGFKNSLLIDYEKSTPLIDGPNNRGFDESFITPNCPNTDPLYIYIENGMVPVPADHRHKRQSLPNPGGKWRWDNDEGWAAPGYKFVDADILFFEKTRDFITDHVAATPDQPFFAVLSTQIAHAPVLPAKEFEGNTEAGPRGDFVFELDVLTGRILDLVKQLEIDDNTLILFNSDNGAETVHVDWMRQDHDHDASGGWRGMKRDGWEGGHRVPFIARWPTHIPRGLVSNQLTNTTDIFATLASVVGYQLNTDDATDSFDMLPAMLGAQNENNSIRPHMLTQSFRGEFQVRQGNWKYLDHKGSGGNNYEKGAIKKYALDEKAPSAPGQLYNLHNDPGETNNLFFQNEAKRKELQQLLAKLKKSGRSAPEIRRPMSVENVDQDRER